MANRRNLKSPANRSDARVQATLMSAKDFLTSSEVDRLLEAAKQDRHSTRDHLLMLTAWRSPRRSGCDVMILISIHARLWVRRVKNGLSVEHPIAGDQLRVKAREFMAILLAATSICYIQLTVTSRPLVLESPLANTVTAWPKATSSSVSQATTRSVPP